MSESCFVEIITEIPKKSKFIKTKLRWEDCPVCKHLFKKVSLNQKYCSTRCRDKIYYNSSKEKIIKKNSEWQKTNKSKVKEYNKKAYKKYIRTHPIQRLNLVIRARIYQRLRNIVTSETLEKDLGYTINDLKIHLERQFKDGMSWDNYGLKGWHIDHIKPLSLFNIEKVGDLEFKKAWSLSNLQPLWALENIKKSNKYDIST